MSAEKMESTENHMINSALILPKRQFVGMTASTLIFQVIEYQYFKHCYLLPCPLTDTFIKKQLLNANFMRFYHSKNT